MPESSSRYKISQNDNHVQNLLDFYKRLECVKSVQEMQKTHASEKYPQTNSGIGGPNFYIRL